MVAVVASANDLGERCSLVVGDFGYQIRTMRHGEPAIKITPQSASSTSAAYIASDDALTMRDYDRFSRVVLNNWRRGAGQIVTDVSDPLSRARYYDSTGMVVSDGGLIRIANSCSSVYSAAIGTTSAAPVLGVPGYLYLGVESAVKFSAAWTGAPSSAATSAAGQVNHMVSDGSYVYAAVQGVGINRFAIGSVAAGTAWEVTKNAPQRLLYANRRLYEIDSSTLYEISLAAAVVTTDFTPPSGWLLMDLCAKRGGTLDSPIIIAARSTNGTSDYRGDRSMTFYWDGTTIHDYVALPIGFSVRRMIQYLGTIFLYGVQANSDNSVSPAVYYIRNDTLGFLGFLGVQQSNGNPTSAGNVNTAAWGLDATGTFVYFSVNGASVQDVWKYDIVNGGLTRYVNTGTSATLLAGELACYGGMPWVSALNGSGTIGLFGSQTTYVATATLDTSDLNLGQPWATNIWARLELSFRPLAAGEAIAVSYSTDSGTTFTATDSTSATMRTTTLAAKSATWLISSSSASVAVPYIRLRFTLTAGTSSLTTPSLYAASLKAIPANPSGVVIEAWVNCVDENYMPNGQPDWQGASGAERIRAIQDAYESQGLVRVIYLRAGTTRAKSPTTISALIDDYEVWEYDSVGVRPGGSRPYGVEGDVRVVLRQVS